MGSPWQPAFVCSCPPQSPFASHLAWATERHHDHPRSSSRSCSPGFHPWRVLAAGGAALHLVQHGKEAGGRLEQPSHLASGRQPTADVCSDGLWSRPSAHRPRWDVVHGSARRQTPVCAEAGRAGMGTRRAGWRGEKSHGLRRQTAPHCGRKSMVGHRRPVWCHGGSQSSSAELISASGFGAVRLPSLGWLE